MGTGRQIAEYARNAYDVGGGYIFGQSGATWTQAKQDNMAANRKDDPDYKESIKYGSKWIGHQVWDCSGLTMKGAAAAGVSIHHGSNSTWNGDCSHKGELTSGLKLPIGAFVFVYRKKDGKRSHIGVVTGENEVTEASCARLGVIKSKIHNDKWHEWGLCKGVEFDFIPGEGPQPEPDPGDRKPTLRKGDRGPYVTLAQTMLINKGYSCGEKGADGIFGNDTLAAVKKFQRASGLDDDGVIGPLTWAKLEAADLPMYTVTIPHLAKYHAEALVNNYPGATMQEEG